MDSSCLGIIIIILLEWLDLALSNLLNTVFLKPKDENKRNKRKIKEKKSLNSKNKILCHNIEGVKPSRLTITPPLPALAGSAAPFTVVAQRSIDACHAAGVTV